MKQINDFKEQLNYVPTKLFYKEISLDSPGYYSTNVELLDSTSNLEVLVEIFQEMENLIKKNFKLSEEKLIKFTNSNPVLITLREELELVNKEKN